METHVPEPRGDTVRPFPRKHEPTDGVSLHLVLAAIRKQFWLALAVALAVILAAAAYGFSAKKIYSATATILIDPKPPTPLGHGVESVEDGAASYWATQEYFNTQHKILASKPIALIAVRQLGLHQDLAFIANVAGQPGNEVEPVTPTQAADILLARLNVAPIKDSRLVVVSYEEADKLRAARILEAHLQAYVDYNINQTVENVASAATWLSEQLDTLRNELGSSELALHNYKLQKQIPTIGLEDQASVLLREMQELTSARTEVRARLQKATARLTQLKTMDITRPESIPQSELLHSMELRTLRVDLIEALRDVTARRGSGKGEQHPEMLAATAKLTTTSEAIRDEVRNAISGVELELAALQHEEGGLSSLLKGAEAKALDLNLMEIEYTRLKRTKNNNEKLYSLVLERSKETNLSQMLRINNVRIVSSVEPQDRPVAPRLPIIWAVGTILGFALGAGAGFLRERMDRTVKSSGELEERLGLTSLGVVPSIVSSGSTARRSGRRAKQANNQEAIELLPLKEPTGGVAEAVRNIRTNILFMSPDRRFKRLLITSAGPAEGKTTLACYVGIAMAQTGQRVLLVDCDMRRPRIHRVFPQREGAPTVSSSLIESKFQDTDLLATDIENLSVMQAGPMPPNPAELLHSKSFHDLLERLSAQYDLIIIDSPPLVVTDAAIIATLVDGTILVVRALQTEFNSVQRALRAVTDVGGHVIGAVLNGALHGKGRYGYGYYGYGGYGTYGQKGADKSPDEARS